MPKLIPIKFRKFVKILKMLGFEEKRIKGSHYFFAHKDGRFTTVPFKKRELSDGILHQILKDINLSVKEYEKLRIII